MSLEWEAWLDGRLFDHGSSEETDDVEDAIHQALIELGNPGQAVMVMVRNVGA